MSIGNMTSQPQAAIDPEAIAFRVWARPRWCLGGLQRWADVRLAGKWKIQQHATLSQFRLLDAFSRCHAEGSFYDCNKELERRLGRPMTNEAAVLLHGITANRFHLMPLASTLRSRGIEAFPIEYPSLCHPIDWHARNLARVIDGLRDHSKVHLVGDSMGGLVVRKCLADRGIDRIGRVVLVGTPNQGAHKADFWINRTNLFLRLFGPAGLQLSTGPHGICHQLPPTMDVEFGLIAGRSPHGRGFSWIIPGDDDGVVAVDSVRMPGAKEFRTVIAPHAAAILLPTVRRWIANFLKHGSMSSAPATTPRAVTGVGA